MNTRKRSTPRICAGIVLAFALAAWMQASAQGTGADAVEPKRAKPRTARRSSAKVPAPDTAANRRQKKTAAPASTVIWPLNRNIRIIARLQFVGCGAGRICLGYSLGARVRGCPCDGVYCLGGGKFGAHLD